MRFISLLLAPSLSFAAVSGTVTLLDGTPIAGAVIKAGTDSVTTTANGTWTLARASGIASRSGKTISVTSHLTVENGRPRISFGGMDISGRSRASGSPADAMRSSRDDKGPATAAGRSSASRDTLRLYWKGKRLTVLPVPADTGNITFKIDTAWKDDAGIPWNPSIAYGSLLDARDGQTYRTVTIWSQTWMAENLNNRLFGSCYESSQDSCARYGRMVGWSHLISLDCPEGWHVPSLAEFLALFSTLGGDSVAAYKLKSASGWHNYRTDTAGFSGSDEYGFRALPSGIYFPDSQQKYQFSATGRNCFLWTSSVFNDGVSATHVMMDWSDRRASTHVYGNRTKMPIRCLKDSP